MQSTRVRQIAFCCVAFFVFVVLPPILYGLATLEELWRATCGDEGAGMLYTAFIILWWLWFLPVGALVGEDYFEFGIGLWPRGLCGWVITGTFYMLISVGVCLFRGWLGRERKGARAARRGRTTR